MFDIYDSYVCAVNIQIIKKKKTGPNLEERMTSKIDVLMKYKLRYFILVILLKYLQLHASKTLNFSGV